MKRIFTLFLVLVGAGISLDAAASGANIYITQNTQGGDTGADAADAHSMAWLNNGANWGSGPSQVGPGTTVHLVGTLTSTLTPLGSGTAGNPITIHFEPNAMFSTPTLPANSIWINVAGLAYIIIDGGNNGLIQLTDNGTVAANGGTCDYGNGNIGGIYAYGINNITIQNLTIKNLYNRQTNNEPVQAGEDGYAIFWTGSGLTVSNCFLTGCQDMISGAYTSPAGSNLTVVACTLSNYNHGVTLGTGGVVNPFFYNVSVTHNTLQGGDMFESQNGSDYGLHRDPIFFFNSSPDGSGYISNIVVAYNYINQGFKPQSSTAGSAAMFFNLDFTMAYHVRVYNNISTLVAPLCWCGGGGMISACGTDVLVANNTAVGWESNGVYTGSQISVYGTNAYLYNNICVSSVGEWVVNTQLNPNGIVVSVPAVTNLLSGLWSDYNIYNGQGGGSFYEIIFLFSGATWTTALFDSLSQWTNYWYGKGFYNFDQHSVTTPMQFDSSFIPLSSDTVAVGKGTNLTAWGITDDYAGNPRPATGNWTIGAYQVTDHTGSNVNIFNAPSSGGGGGGGGSSTAAGITGFPAGGGGADVTNGLLVQWRFNQANGTTVVDSSGNGYTGTLTGLAGWTNGLVSSEAVSIPTNDGALNSPNGVMNNSLAYSGDWTVTLWVNNSSFPGVGDTAASFSASSWLFTSYDGYSWGFSDGIAFHYASLPLQANAWYFIALSKSSGTNYQLYLNGAANNAFTGANVNISGLSAGNRSGGSFGMVGEIADLRIFNRVLSANEISILTQNGPNDIAGPVIPPVTGIQATGVSP